jgi:disulfide bond formation protein DsbB
MTLMNASALPRLVAFGILAASALALGTAFVAQYVFGLQPCELCIAQRVPYALAVVVGLVALALPADSPKLVLLVKIAAALFLIDSVIAFYHVGVEQHWWASITACSGGVPDQLSIQDLNAAMQARPEKACDQPDWDFHGITIAGFNTAAALVLAIVTFVAAGKLAEGRRR